MRTHFLFVLVAMTLVAGCPPPDTQTTCRTDDDCTDNESCVDGEGSKVCAAACDLGNTCDDGFACIEADDGAHCHLIPGNRELGEACEADLACTSGACAIESDGPVCVSDCTDGESCPDNTRCMLSGHRLLCLSPLDDRVDGDPCETPRDCASAFCVEILHKQASVCAAACANGCAGGNVCVPLDVGEGVCLPPAADGDPCATAEICTGALCVSDTDGTQICASACVDQTCAANFACVPLESGTRACLPNVDDRVDGAECASSRECASGFCGRFNTDTESFGDLCAAACVDGECDSPNVCWTTTTGTDLCGPQP